MTHSCVLKSMPLDFVWFAICVGIRCGCLQLLIIFSSLSVFVTCRLKQNIYEPESRKSALCSNNNTSLRRNIYRNSDCRHKDLTGCRPSSLTLNTCRRLTRPELESVYFRTRRLITRICYGKFAKENLNYLLNY